MRTAEQEAAPAQAPKPRRSHDRQVAVIYRLSEQNREHLKQRAADAGYATVQDFLDHVLLGPLAPHKRQEELPMTG